MHAVCTEMTGQILGERRQRLLHDLSAVGGQLGDEHETVAAMCRALAGDALDLPFAAVYLSVPGEPGSRRVAAVGCDAARLPAVVGGAADAGRARRRRSSVTGGPFGDRVTEAVVLPLTATRDGEPLGLLLAGAQPQPRPGRRVPLLLRAGRRRSSPASWCNIRAFEAERLRAESLAELDRAKTTFFSDVSHELRTPLTLLLGPIGDVLDEHRRAAAGHRPRAARAGPAQRPAPAAAGQRPARLRQHRGRPGAPGAGARPTSRRSPPSSPGSSAPPPSGPGCG